MWECRQSLWVIGRVSTLQGCAPWAALIKHAAAKGCLFAALRPFEQLLRASHDELTADAARAITARSSRQTKERRRGRSSGEELVGQKQPRQKRPRLEPRNGSSAPAPPDTASEPRRKSQIPPNTANRKQEHVNSRASNEEAAAEPSGCRQAGTTAGNLREGTASARQVHAGLQSASSIGASNQDQERPAEQHESASSSEWQQASRSRPSAADRDLRDLPAGHASSSVAQASAGKKVTAISNPLLQRMSLLGSSARQRSKPVEPPD